MMTDEQAQTLAQGKADARVLVEQIQAALWRTLAGLRIPADDGEPVPPISHAPHITIEALSGIVLELLTALVSRDATTELPRARHHVQLLELQVDLLAATLTDDAPKC